MSMYESPHPRDYDHLNDGLPRDGGNNPDQPPERDYAEVDQPLEDPDALDQPEVRPAARVQNPSAPGDLVEADTAMQQPEDAEGDQGRPSPDPAVDAQSPGDAHLEPHIAELLANAQIVLPMSSEALQRMAESMAVGMVRHRETLPAEWSLELIDAALEQQRRLFYAVQRAAIVAREIEERAENEKVVEPSDHDQAIASGLDEPGEPREEIGADADAVSDSGPEATGGGENEPPSPPTAGHVPGEDDDPWFWVRIDNMLNEADRTILKDLMSASDVMREGPGPSDYLAIQKDIHDTPEGEDYPARVAGAITEVVDALRAHGTDALKQIPQSLVDRLGTQILALGDTLEAQMRAIQTLPPQSIGPEESASARARLDILMKSWSEPFELYEGREGASPGMEYLALDRRTLAASAEARRSFPQEPPPPLSSADFSRAGVSNAALAQIGVFNAGLDDMAYRISREADTLRLLETTILNGQLVIAGSEKGDQDMLDDLNRLVKRFEGLDESLEERMRVINRFYKRRMPLFRS